MISSIDLAIVIAYLVIVALVGAVVSRGTDTDEDLFLGGRTLTWGVIGLSLFASNISSTTLVGLAGAAYTSGIVNAVWEFGAVIPFVVLAIFFVPVYLQGKISTVPEFLECRFDRRSRVFFSAITIITSIVVDTAGGLYAGALVLQSFLPDLPLAPTCFGLALFAGIYTAFGGLKAVVYTDALQAIILLVGCTALTVAMFGRIDYSLDALWAAAPAGHFSLIRPVDDSTMPWPALLLGVPFLGFWYVATNQYITQRVLGARSVRHARWGIMLACFLKMTPLFVMILPGAMAIVVFPDLANGDLVFPTMVREVLPVGMVGIVLAGLISAIMSSVDSTLNSASALIVLDFLKVWRPQLTARQTAHYGRVSTLVLMVVAALWAPQIAHFGGLWGYLQQMFSIIVPPIAAVFLLGVFDRRANGAGAYWTLILGTALGVILFVLDQWGWWPVHYLVTVGIVVAASCGLVAAISRATEPPRPEVVERWTFAPHLAHLENDGPWYQNYLIQSAVALVLVFAHYLLLT
ncbi:MAG: sodium:solute symporter [Myxococcota bacterium]